MDDGNIKRVLEKHYEMVERIILERQNPITGLLPASTAITAHGDYTDAWVRDNVYSILCVWGLALAFEKHTDQDHRAFTLRQSVVKLMRGLLRSMMRQAHKVEAYKKSRDPLDALHAKYATDTGESVVEDDAWGHLQLDATSLFVLMLAQMNASGLRLIYTQDELDFVQNLVHYISRTYATPDYGIWERGNKINHGKAEINASSVGMAKAALEAIEMSNFFHVEGAKGRVHIVPNDLARSCLTLESLLPRESNSKESDAALLSIIGYPAYAVKNEDLKEKTKTNIVKKLCGNYGAKRFLLDGHQSVLEDSSRLHYEPSELREFADIESEWPLFFTYLLLDALMQGKTDEAHMWREKLEPLFVEQEGLKLLPELYYVPQESIEAEKQRPHSQARLANENIPLVWAQSLFMLSEMLFDGVLEPSDIDPLGRRVMAKPESKVKALTPIIAQNAATQEALASWGVASYLPDALGEIAVMYASELTKVQDSLGANKKLSLSGRSLLWPRSITTSRLHLLGDRHVLFLPYYFDPQSFYFGFDNFLLVEHFIASMAFLDTYGHFKKRGVLAFFVREDMLRDHTREPIIALLKRLENPSIEAILHESELETIACSCADSLVALQSQTQDTNEYAAAALAHDWTQVRLLAQERSLYDVRLEDALTEILIAQKRLGVGRAYTPDAIIEQSLDAPSIIALIERFCGESPAERVLTQEIILHFAHLIRTQSHLFSKMLTLRTWDAIQLLVGHISKERSFTMGEAYEELLRFSPQGIYDLLRLVYGSYKEEIAALKELENIKVSGKILLNTESLVLQEHRPNDMRDWAEYRENAGKIGMVSEDFYQSVWHILQRCQALVIGDKYSLQSRIDATLTHESTAGERSFELKVDSLLMQITSSAYKQLNIELIETLGAIMQANETLVIEDELILDVLIGHAVRLAWHSQEHEGLYEEHKGAAWREFYRLSREAVQQSFIAAFSYLLQERR